MPTANRSINFLLGRSADRRKKVRMHVALPINASTRSKRVAQKIKADFRMLRRTTSILAVNDTRLVGMDFQTALTKAIGDPLHDVLRLATTAAMQQTVICVSAERDAWQLASSIYRATTNAHDSNYFYGLESVASKRLVDRIDLGTLMPWVSGIARRSSISPNRRMNCTTCKFEFTRMGF